MIFVVDAWLFDFGSLVFMAWFETLDFGRWGFRLGLEGLERSTLKSRLPNFVFAHGPQKSHVQNSPWSGSVSDGRESTLKRLS